LDCILSHGVSLSPRAVAVRCRWYLGRCCGGSTPRSFCTAFAGGGRLQIGIPAGINSEYLAGMRRNLLQASGRFHPKGPIALPKKATAAITSTVLRVCVPTLPLWSRSNERGGSGKENQGCHYGRRWQSSASNCAVGKELSRSFLRSLHIYPHAGDAPATKNTGRWRDAPIDKKCNLDRRIAVVCCSELERVRPVIVRGSTALPAQVHQ
jgi:hypothetical protein